MKEASATLLEVVLKRRATEVDATEDSNSVLVDAVLEAEVLENADPEGLAELSVGVDTEAPVDVITCGTDTEFWVSF